MKYKEGVVFFEGIEKAAGLIAPENVGPRRRLQNFFVSTPNKHVGFRPHVHSTTHQTFHSRTSRGIRKNFPRDVRTHDRPPHIGI
jgi:hypothetical protein